VRTSNDEFEVIELLRHHTVQDAVAILDHATAFALTIDVSQHDGWEVFEQLREWRRHLLVIIALLDRWELINITEEANHTSGRKRINQVAIQFLIDHARFVDKHDSILKTILTIATRHTHTDDFACFGIRITWMCEFE